jgi:hypothetical protein
MAEDPVLAKPPGACCLKGAIHDGEPEGECITVAGVETYVSAAKENANGNIVLYFPDIFALFKNGRLVMDSIACAGYQVLGLDYFQGVSFLKRND